MALADEYYVVFFDQRGSGLSPRVNTEEITQESAIADLDSIVEYFGQGKIVNIVGHSWGAMLAPAYLGRYPEKVDHVVLAEPGFLNSEFAEKWAKGTQQASYYCEGVKPDENVSWRFGAAAGNAIYQEAVDADGNFDINLAKGVEQFENTVLFMTGECQQLIGAEFQSRQTTLFPSAELAVIPDAGHEMFFENPEASVEVVRAYLNAPAQ